MSYCNIGDTPKVYVEFNGQNKQTYEPKISPIDVSSEDYYPDGINYSPTGYQISFYSPNNGIRLAVVARNFVIHDRGSIYSSIDIQLCGQDDFTINYANIDPSTLVINTAITCGNSKPRTKKTKIHIKKAGESSDLFTVFGDYPGTFQVACNARCPDGFCECPSLGYPGYCCLDCRAIASELRSITNSLRS
ncbi:MAG: hypothetical protein V7K40_30035 [Nostoc sp.]|uniref:hypothetical protein n=1 Tax=Nostoc sp. TaxID=1180 RepID=UPI002FF6C4CE